MQAHPIVDGHFYCISLKASAIARSSLAASAILYCIDRELVSLEACLPTLLVCNLLWMVSELLAQIYEPFFEDFGPLNLGQAYRFCCRTNTLRQVRVVSPSQLHHLPFIGRAETCAWLHQEANQRQKALYFYTGTSEQQRANAAVLVCPFPSLASCSARLHVCSSGLLTLADFLQVGLYQVLLMDRSPEAAYQAVKGLAPFAPFRDASCGQSCFDLTVLHCLQASIQHPNPEHQSCQLLELSQAQLERCQLLVVSFRVHAGHCQGKGVWVLGLAFAIMLI